MVIPAETLKTRVGVLETLLERYVDLVDPMQVRAGKDDGDPSLGLMPITYTPSVRELERLLRTMRDDRRASLLTLESGEKVSVRKCWWHVNAWYLAVETVMVAPARTPRRNRPKELHRDQVDIHGRRLPIRQIRRDKAARLEVAGLGVRWMAEHWGLRGEPMVPTEVLKVAA